MFPEILLVLPLAASVGWYIYDLWFGRAAAPPVQPVEVCPAPPVSYPTLILQAADGREESRRRFQGKTVPKEIQRRHGPDKSVYYDLVSSEGDVHIFRCRE